MGKKKIDYKLLEKDTQAWNKFKHNFIKNTLRRATYRWPSKTICKNNAKKDYALYECSDCKKVFSPSLIEIDHIVPVSSVKTGFVDWNDFIDRLFVTSDKMQVLCINCHELKSQIENTIRRENGLKEERRKKRKKK